jgi:ParB family chromosome partitioning protein
MTTFARNRAKETLRLEGIRASQTNPYFTQLVPLDNIIVSDQPRHNFQDIDELSQSIESNGLLNPVIVMESGKEKDKVVLIAGERRLRAFKKLNKLRIPAIVTPYSSDQKEILTKQLVENIQRDELTVLEIAEAFLILKDQGLSADGISKETGKSKRTIYKYLQIAGLHEDLKSSIRDNQLSIQDIEKRFLGSNEKEKRKDYSKEFLKKTKHTFKLNLNKLRTISDFNSAIGEVETLLTEIKSVMHDTLKKNDNEGGE